MDIYYKGFAGSAHTAGTEESKFDCLHTGEAKEPTDSLSVYKAGGLKDPWRIAGLWSVGKAKETGLWWWQQQ